MKISAFAFRPAPSRRAAHDGVDLSRAARALSAESSREIWRTREGSHHSSPLVTEDGIFTGNFDHRVYSYDPDTGAQRWNFNTHSHLAGRPCLSPDRKALYATSRSTRLHFLDPASGEPLREPIPVGGVVAGPAVDPEGHVVVGNIGGELSGFDGKSGERLWTYQLPEHEPGFFVPPLTRDDGAVVALGAGGRVVCLEAAGGEVRWEKKTGALYTEGALARDGSPVVVELGGRVVALDPDFGEERWSFETGSKTDLGPQILGDTVFLVSNEGRLVALAAEDGRTQWERKVEGRPRALTVEADRLAVATDSRVETFQIADGSPSWQSPLKDRPLGAASLEGRVFLTGTGAVWALDGAAQPKILTSDPEVRRPRIQREAASVLIGDVRVPVRL